MALLELVFQMAGEVPEQHGTHPALGEIPTVLVAIGKGVGIMAGDERL
jgi:hypothetical protein